MNNKKKFNLNLIMNLCNQKEQINANALALAIAGITGLSLIFLLMRGAFPTPFSDEFYFFQIYIEAKQGNINFNEIFKPHFGHIYVLLKSWFWLVVYYDIDWRASMYVQVAFVTIAIFLVLRYSLLRIKPNTRTRLFLVLSIAFVIGSARQSENLYWAIQVSAANMLLFTIIAFYSVAKFYETQKNIYAALAFASGLVALISNGGGIASFFIILTAIATITSKTYLRLMCAAIGMFFFAGILNYMLPSREAGINSPAISAESLLIYTLAFFSNSLFSFSDKGNDPYSLFLGSAILIYTANSIKSSWHFKNKNIFPYLLICFSLASCLLIAYARLKSGIWQPNASRYYPFAAMILVGNLLILGRAEKKIQTHFTIVIYLAITISFLQSYFTEWKTSPHRYIYSKNAHANLCIENNKELAFHGDLKYTNIKILKDVFCADQDAAQININ